VFSVATSHILQQVRQHLDALGLIHHVHNLDPRGLLHAIGENSRDTIDVTEVSFGVFPVVASASTLVHYISVIMGVIEQVFQEHGLEVNYGPGKTEVLVNFRGIGAASARKSLAVDAGNKISFIGARGCVDV
jgi:hypothetical protein